MANAGGILIAPDTLRHFVEQILHAGGFWPAEAEATARSLVLSNLTGHDSHGVICAVDYLSDLKTGGLVSGVDLAVQQETLTGCVVDGQRGPGQVQMPRLLDLVVGKARTHGFATGAMRDCGHIGRLGEWVEYIAARNMIGMVAVNDNGALYCVAPPGGKEACTSTNPIAFGIPLPDGETFAIDLSTSAVAVGKIRLAWRSGQECAPGLIQDSDGNSTTDPSVLFEEPKGAIRPMGGYKGFALSMMIDCLVAGLSGGFAPPAPDGALPLNNVLACVWDPKQFAGMDHMRDQTAKYIDFVRRIAPVDLAEPIRIAGDRARAEKQARGMNGISLDRATARALIAAAEAGHVPIPIAFQDID